MKIKNKVRVMAKIENDKFDEGGMDQSKFTTLLIFFTKIFNH